MVKVAAGPSTIRSNKDSVDLEFHLSQPTALTVDSLFRNVGNTKDFFEGIFESIHNALKEAIISMREGYSALRTSLITEVNQLLKAFKIDYDFGVWLDGFEKAVVGCAIVQRTEIKANAQLLFNDTLTCVQTNVDKLGEMKKRGSIAVKILKEAPAVYRSHYTKCAERYDKPAQATGFDERKTSSQEMGCIAKAIQQTASFVRPVPGHFYALGKMLFNVSYTNKKEAINCLKEKYNKHALFLTKAAKDMAVCVAFST